MLKSHSHILIFALFKLIEESEIESGFMLFGTSISSLASIIEILLSSFKAFHVLNVKL
jgi:hypothetical protein